jgi:hypothetical protein
MNSIADWRYENVKHLQGAVFRYAKYKAPTIDWDHDHCNGCWAKFAEFDDTDILHEGYVSAKPYEPTPEPEFITQARQKGKHPISQPVLDGFTLQWLCPGCFDDFREVLGFRLEPDADKTAFIKDCIISIVSDDYESFEIIMKDIKPLMDAKGMAANEAEVAAVLATVIVEDFVDAFTLSTRQPYAVKVAYDPSRLDELWYYVTERGKANAKGIQSLSGEDDSQAKS